MTWIGLGVLPERWRLKIVLIGGGGRSSASESDAVRVEMDEVIEGCLGRSMVDDGIWEEGETYDCVSERADRMGRRKYLYRTRTFSDRKKRPQGAITKSLRGS